MKRYEIAVLPGDGIGNEVMPEALRALEKVGGSFGIEFAFRHFDWSCETHAKTGRMMPVDGIEQLRPHDAILLGAVGFPSVADHVSLWGLSSMGTTFVAFFSQSHGSDPASIFFRRTGP